MHQMEIFKNSGTHLLTWLIISVIFHVEQRNSFKFHIDQNDQKGVSMNISKFTQKSVQAVQDLEKVAYEFGNQEIEQEHLLYNGTWEGA